MIRLEGGFSAKEYKRRLESGKNQLRRYYQKNITQWPRQTRPEYAIRNVVLDGAPITGIIDRLDWVEDQTVRIVDYKTGTSSSKKIKPPSKARPYGGTYWRQLYFYQLLYQQSSINSQPARQGVISFLDPDRDGNLVDEVFDFEVEHTAFVRQLIQETYQKILDQQFFEGCNEERCSWCQFLKKNVAVNSFSEPEIEELDD